MTVMVWRNSTEGTYTRGAAAGEWLIERYEPGGPAELRFLPSTLRAESTAVPIAVCESVAEARVISHALDRSLEKDIGSPLEQLVDAGYVEEWRVPSDRKVRLLALLTSSGDGRALEHTGTELWMTRRDGSVTVVVDEDGSIPIFTFQLDMATSRGRLGSVFYRPQHHARVRGELGSAQISMAMCAYLQIMRERENLNGSHLTPLQGGQHIDVAANFESGHYPILAEDLAPRL